MGKLKVVSEALDPELELSIDLARPEACYIAGEIVSGSITCHAAHPFECEDIVVTLAAKEQVTGTERRPFRWEHGLLEQKVNLGNGQIESFPAGSHSRAFSIQLEPTLLPTYLFESVSIGSRSQIKLARVYSISVVYFLRNSTKVEATAVIMLMRYPDVVWPGSLHILHHSKTSCTSP